MNYELEKFRELIDKNLPIEHFGIKSLLRKAILDFDENGSKIETACIQDNPLKITFCKKFIEKEINTAQELVFVFIHECFHYLFGHLAKDLFKNEQNKQLINLVLDTYINATIYRLFVGFSGTKFLIRFYPKDEFPVNFLRPDSVLRTRNRKLRYKTLWDSEDNFLSLQDIYYTLRYEELNKNTKYIGSHNTELSNDRKMPEEFKVILEKIKKRSREQNGMNKVYQDILLVEKYENKLAEQQMRKWLPNQNLLKIDKFAKHYVFTPKRSVIPSKHDKKIGLLALDYVPTFWKNKTYAPFSSQIDCYIDVSGSVNKYIKTLMSFVAKYHELINDPIFQFSEKCVEISKKDFLKKPFILTSYGTTDCFITKAIERKVKDIVVFTDCELKVSKENIKKFKEQRIKMYLFLINNQKVIGDLKELVKESYVLQKD
jgi:hypothetical protein